MDSIRVTDQFNFYSYISQNNISHISFDFWNTLAYSNPLFKSNRNDLIKNSLNNKVTNNEIDNCFKLVGNNYNSKMVSNNFIEPPFILFKKVFDHLGISQQNQMVRLYLGILDLFAEFAPIMSKKFDLFFFTTLKEMNISISVTSNTAFIPGSSIKEFLSTKGLVDFFDFFLFSDAIQHAKPSLYIFDLLFNKASLIEGKSNITKDMILHIGDDNTTDYLGSKSYGIKSILV
jgi:putative hydrolase of the HAD superfamily